MFLSSVLVPHALEERGHLAHWAPRAGPPGAHPRVRGDWGARLRRQVGSFPAWWDRFSSRFRGITGRERVRLELASGSWWLAGGPDVASKGWALALSVDRPVSPAQPPVMSAEWQGPGRGLNESCSADLRGSGRTQTECQSRVCWPCKRLQARDVPTRPPADVGRMERPGRAARH